MRTVTFFLPLWSSLERAALRTIITSPSRYYRWSQCRDPELNNICKRKLQARIDLTRVWWCWCLLMMPTMQCNGEFHLWRHIEILLIVSVAWTSRPQPSRPPLSPCPPPGPPAQTSWRRPNWRPAPFCGRGGWCRPRLWCWRCRGWWGWRQGRPRCLL